MLGKIFSLQNVVLSVFKNKDLIANSELSESRVFYSQTTLSRVFGAASRQETLPLHTYD